MGGTTFYPCKAIRKSLKEYLRSKDIADVSLQTLVQLLAQLKLAGLLLKILETENWIQLPRWQEVFKDCLEHQPALASIGC